MATEVQVQKSEAMNVLEFSLNLTTLLVNIELAVALLLLIYVLVVDYVMEKRESK